MSRVLLIEDDSQLAATMQALLADHGHDVRLATTIAAASAMYHPGSFDVVLCDYELPEYEGGLNTAGRGTLFLANVHGRPGRRPLTILWSGLDRKKEVAKEMPMPPDHVLLKGYDGMMEVVRLAATRDPS